MSNELVINSTQEGSRIALMRDKGLVELHYDNDETKFQVGDIYLGVVRKVVPGLNAAFIDIGYDKDAFLHYLDLGPKVRSLLKYIKLAQGKHHKHVSENLKQFRLEPEIDKLGKINEVLKQNQKIMVQVVKEPISTKGPRLSCELSLAGRYLVLVPFSNTVNISKKITDASERRRLLKLVNSIKPENFGVIIRTVAEGQEAPELNNDLRDLVTKWGEGVEKLKVAKPREKVIGEMNRATSMLRDILNESFDSITVDDKDVYDEIRRYIQQIQPDKAGIVKHYTGKTKLFEHTGIEKQLKTLFGQTVSLGSGGYLVIEHTEALHVIDVNSGNKSNAENNQEATAFNVNLEAATEIARQLRLRDMGGIIVIDFIDMKKAEHKQKLYQHMKQEMKADRSKHTVLPLSKFGLMQITRQRVRPELSIVTKEKCPTCNGTGKITASIAIADQVEAEVMYLLEKQNGQKLKLGVHPYLYSYFTGGFPSRRMKWFFNHFKWIKIFEDSSLALSEYKFFDHHDEEISLK
ncbi:Rne/Rng family ribonuclease [Flammeovirga yaeyamensis]|uniref:Rne/Rng family ribonuclease n=1 Tax=Flammeovirga yaeyamensis TaxID=367791 RepID=A0AAX1N6H1_9BACT|nr:MULTISPECIES: Rne/Rng family ribonuclease [Flammeovirga]ANQ50756.2 Rne/Rng family ribonuclease [Flammeovirga sp. MY04]MBB3701531.1 ribonuclease G [Flammeovirga yaeyamensis]NMF38655.1 Rne/Rng family ribonuclease [Flammeovirga yaeyamensis]QWG01850.1 Rne/Rng family ribonuclease [Flammeovirga yaeyamensis]